MAREKGSSWTGIILLVASIALVALGIWYWKRPKDEEPQFRTATVSRGDVTQAVSASGQLNPVVNVQVGSQVSGIIEKLYVDFNSSVTNGQVVAQLDAATYRANVNQAEGELSSARASLKLAQVNAKRAEELIRSKLISQSEFETTMVTLPQAESMVKIREAALEKSKVDLARTTIYAPIDGIVISRNVDVGQTVAASLSAPTLFVIANDLTKMQIDALVSEADVGGVEEGQKVNFTVDAFPYRTFKGSVKQVRNAALTNQNVVSYDAVIEVNNADQKLKPGMTATVSIVLAERANTLKIPNAAFRFRPPEPEAKKGVEPSRGGGAASGPATNQTAQAGGTNSTSRGEGGQGRGRRGGPGGAAERRASGEMPPVDRPIPRTIYVLENKAGSTEPTLKPVTVKAGISDGSATEILEGLNEGDVVVVGLNVSQSTQPATANPFGGGGSFRRF